MKMKTIVTTLLTFALILTGCAAPVISTGEETKSPTIRIIGTGNASAKPDIVDIQLGVETTSSEPADAVSDNTDRMNAIMDVLEKKGVSGEDIQTVYYSMWVEEIYDETGQPTGERRFRVTNQINVRLDDLSQIGTLLEDAINAGVTTVIGINFGVADTSELEQSALNNAVADARQKAERIASDMGFELGDVQMLIEGGAEYPPVPYYGEKVGLGGGGAGPIQVSEGQFSVTMQVQIVFEMIP